MADVKHFGDTEGVLLGISVGSDESVGNTVGVLLGFSVGSGENVGDVGS